MRNDTSTLRLALMPALALLLAACGGEQPPPPAVFNEAALPVPADPILALGQGVYRSDCATCHDRGKKGAPRAGNAGDWTPRLGRGLDTLITHATQGYLGPAGDEMPARGGNEDLSDEQVAAAVRYIASLIH